MRERLAGNLLYQVVGTISLSITVDIIPQPSEQRLEIAGGELRVEPGLVNPVPMPTVLVRSHNQSVLVRNRVRHTLFAGGAVGRQLREVVVPQGL